MAPKNKKQATGQKRNAKASNKQSVQASAKETVLKESPNKKKRTKELPVEPEEVKGDIEEKVKDESTDVKMEVDQQADEREVVVDASKD